MSQITKDAKLHIFLLFSSVVVFVWLVVVIAQDDSVTFLATHGDAWDAQKDMALCLVGAGFSLLTLTKLHDRALEKLDS